MEQSIDVSLIWAKHMVGEQVSDEEADLLRRWRIKYELVRSLYVENANKDFGLTLKDFHFSPGDGFLETPVVDIVNSLVDTLKKIQSGDYQELNFGDSRWKEA